MPPSRAPSPPRLLLGALAIALAATALLGACDNQTRFPVCNNDTECTARSDGQKAPYCFDLRCVACRSDEDCGAGHLCTSAKECKPLSGSAPAVSASAPPAEPIAKESWEPATPDDQKKCLATCKGKRDECKKRCGNTVKPPKK
jgi:Cys-rich repeat protein